MHICTKELRDIIESGYVGCVVVLFHPVRVTVSSTYYSKVKMYSYFRSESRY